MSKSKRFSGTLLSMFLCVLLFAPLSYAHGLTTENVSVSEQNLNDSPTLTQTNEYLNYAIADGYTDVSQWQTSLEAAKEDFLQWTESKIEEWHNYLTVENIRDLDSNLLKAQNSNSLKDVGAWKQSSIVIINAAERLKNNRTKAIKKVNKKFNKYKKFITKKQKNSIKKYKNKSNHSFTLADIQKQIKKNNAIIKKAKKVKKMRHAAISKVNKYYKDWKKGLTAQQRNHVKKYKAKIKCNFTKNKITGVQNYIIKYINDIVMIPGINTYGWSVDKIQYVKKWGSKNNKFLSGTPMAGKGY